MLLQAVLPGLARWESGGVWVHLVMPEKAGGSLRSNISVSMTYKKEVILTREKEKTAHVVL